MDSLEGVEGFGGFRERCWRMAGWKTDDGNGVQKSITPVFSSVPRAKCLLGQAGADEVRRLMLVHICCVYILSDPL